MATKALNLKPGVIHGDDVRHLFKYCQEHNFAIPAINVTSSSTAVAALEAARDSKAPIILQVSQGGAAFFCGKDVDNKNQNASIVGGIAAARFITTIAPAYGIPVIMHSDHCAKKLLPWLDGMLDEDERWFKEHGVPLFSSHMIDLSEETVEFNIETTKKYLERAAPMKQWLEMEIGITGGEEDGVNNEDVDNAALYTQPEDIWHIYKTLEPVSPNFSIAAGFGNVHGVYKPGNVKLHPELLEKHQKYVQEQLGTSDTKPVFLVFHGGSGSSVKEYQEAIGYGVVKINLDTDMQYAYTTGIRDYMKNKYDYVSSQVGNPDGADKPNKKYVLPTSPPESFTDQCSADTTTHVCGFTRVRRPWPSALPWHWTSSRLLARCEQGLHMLIGELCGIDVQMFRRGQIARVKDAIAKDMSVSHWLQMQRHSALQISGGLVDIDGW